MTATTMVSLFYVLYVGPYALAAASSRVPAKLFPFTEIFLGYAS